MLAPSVQRPRSVQHALLQMQRARGNQYVGAMLTRLDRFGSVSGASTRPDVPIARAVAKSPVIATGASPRTSIQRDLFDDFGDKVSDLGAAAVAGVRDVGSAIESGAGAVADRVGSTLDDAGNAIASGAHAVGQSLNDGANAAGSAIKGGAAAVAGGAQAAANKAAGPIDWLLTEAGKLALSAANAVASKFGGKVVVSPDAGIDIIFSDIEIAEVDQETVVLPIGIPYKPLFETGFAVGSFVVNASFGSVIGDPAVTVAAGPVRLQHVRLHLDPLGGTYAGTGQLFIGSEVVGSGENAAEARLQAAGVLPFEVPIPVEASAAVGTRDILRVSGRENFQETVAVTFKEGRFELDALTQMKLGALAQVDSEAFVRIDIEGLEVCSVIWPKASHRLAGDAVQITVPVSLTGGNEKPDAQIGKPITKTIPVDTIKTSLDHSRPTNHCLKLSELAPFLCKIGKLPPSLCAIVDPKGGGAVSPTGPVPFGPGPVGPGGGGGGGKGRDHEPVGPLGDDPGCAPKQGFLFRGMKRDGNSPQVGDASGSELGVRDGEVKTDKHDNVVLDGRGMSTTPDDVKKGPARLIPPKCGGNPKNKDTLFAIDEAAVKSTDGLGVNRDAPGHANVIPTKTMTLRAFRDKVHGTVSSWELLVEGER
ncbi:MAG: hypothetical protein ABI277_17510 [Burkholderiaceae bacterium]